MKGILAALFIMLSLTSSACAGENRAFWRDSSDVSEQVAQILMRNGICESINKKCAGHVYAVNPFEGGFEFSVYGVTESSVLQEIKETLKKKFDETPEMTRMVVSFFEGETTASGRFIRRSGLISQEEFRR